MRHENYVCIWWLRRGEQAGTERISREVCSMYYCVLSCGYFAKWVVDENVRAHRGCCGYQRMWIFRRYGLFYCGRKGMVRFVGRRCIIGVSWIHRRPFNSQSTRRKVLRDLVLGSGVEDKAHTARLWATLHKLWMCHFAPGSKAACAEFLPTSSVDVRWNGRGHRGVSKEVYSWGYYGIAT